ncbi:hypothetical protein ACWD3I_23775 [Streptomyces sp. NPDC002817]|uniref:hypothetical protein n=1 Tax=Streptomyces sp. NPDC088357 TaxID=3154655 RepID=UPI00341A5BB1
MTFPTVKALEKRRDEAHEGMVELIGGARATGRLRADFDLRIWCGRTWPRAGRGCRGAAGA